MLTNKVEASQPKLKPRMSDGFNTEVYDQIMRFLSDHKRSSEHTAIAYERGIRNFFKQTREGKDIEHLKKEDLEYSIEQFEDYRDYMLDDLGLSASTASNQITAISECMKHLHRRKLVNKIDFLDIKRAKVVNRSWDGLTSQEVKKVAAYLGSKGRKGKVKRAFLLFTLDTCMREKESLDITWDQFIEKENEVLVRTVAKGQKVMHRRISKTIYNLLLEIKQEGKNRVFDISESTVERLVKDIRSHLNIDTDKRKIVFHSIRKAGAQHIWKKTRDINQVRRMLGHESIQTTELYIDKNEDYGVFGAVSDEFETDDSLYEKVSHRELLEAIRGLNKDTQLFINLKLKENLSK